MKKIFLCTLMCSIICSIKCEYIVIKRTAEGAIVAPSEQEYEQAYKILHKYQFPMCLKHVDRMWADGRAASVKSNVNASQCPYLHLRFLLLREYSANALFWRPFGQDK